MRRALLAVTLGGVLLTGAACDGDTEPKASAPSAPAPTPEPTVSAADYTADTRKVCDNVKKIFDDDLEPFGTALGKMIAFKEAKLPADAAKAQKTAAKQLKTVAGNIRTQTKAAQDPAIRAAGEASAKKFSASADDKAFYAKIKSTKDLDRVIDGQMGEWLTPIAGYCA